MNAKKYDRCEQIFRPGGHEVKTQQLPCDLCSSYMDALIDFLEGKIEFLDDEELHEENENGR